MVQNKPRILIFDDFPVSRCIRKKGWLLSRILNFKGCFANSLTYPPRLRRDFQQNGIDRIESESRSAYGGKQRPDLLILSSRGGSAFGRDLAFSEASIIRILQKIRENNPSLPMFIYSDSVTFQFKNQTTKFGGCFFFPKGNVEQILDQIKKLSLFNKQRELATPCMSKE